MSRAAPAAFNDFERVYRWALLAVLLAIAAHIYSFVALWTYSPPSPDGSTAEQLEHALSKAEVVGYSAMSIFLICLSLVFFLGRLAALNRETGAVGLRFAPWLAALTPVIPGVLFVAPYFVLNEGFRVHDPDAGSQDWKTRPAALSLALAWAGLATCLVISFRMSKAQGTAALLVLTGLRLAFLLLFMHGLKGLRGRVRERWTAGSTMPRAAVHRSENL